MLSLIDVNQVVFKFITMLFKKMPWIVNDGFSNVKLFLIKLFTMFKQILFQALPDGIEPSTFRLTAERANQLRHGSCKTVLILYIS